MKYVFIYFLPGAAGHFFSRCLNLLENSYCFADATTNKIPTTLDEKIELLSYGKIKNKSFDQRNWVQFEKLLTHYERCQPHWDLPHDAVIIWYNHSQSSHDNLYGQADTVHKFYMDSSELFEWTIMNALYKNSYIDVEWLIEYKNFKYNKDLQKINLKKIITSYDGFLDEFQQVCKTIGRVPSDKELIAIKNLYGEWELTRLDVEKIPQFKQDIGFLF